MFDKATLTLRRVNGDTVTFQIELDNYDLSGVCKRDNTIDPLLRHPDGPIEVSLTGELTQTSFHCGR